jgi:epoxyqueuosine reductase
LNQTALTRKPGQGRFVFETPDTMEGPMNTRIHEFLNMRFAESELNRLPEAHGGDRIFDAPVMGVSGGDDPIFDKYKTVVAPEHLTPVEMWSANGFEADPASGAGLRVLSVLFPYVDKIRQESRDAQKMPAEIYSVGRNFANPFMKAVISETVERFKTEGYGAVGGMYNKAFRVIIKTDPPRRYSVWSERHMAFAAGLGTFSLHEGFISAVGCNIRIASVLTDAPLAITPRTSDDPYGNCLYYADGSCLECVARCPADALGKEGHHKEKCRAYVQTVQKVMSKRMGSILKPTIRRLPDGDKTAYPTGCAFCQFGVPCMDKNPVAEKFG